LELLSPSTCAGQVLITPNTEARLVTNRDSAAASMSYDVRGSTNLLKVKQNGELFISPYLQILYTPTVYVVFHIGVYTRLTEMGRVGRDSNLYIAGPFARRLMLFSLFALG